MKGKVEDSKVTCFLLVPQFVFSMDALTDDLIRRCFLEVRSSSRRDQKTPAYWTKHYGWNPDLHIHANVYATFRDTIKKVLSTEKHLKRLHPISKPPFWIEQAAAQRILAHIGLTMDNGSYRLLHTCIFRLARNTMLVFLHRMPKNDISALHDDFMLLQADVIMGMFFLTND